MTGQFYDYGLNIMRSCQCLQSKRNGVFFAPSGFKAYVAFLSYVP